MRLKSTTLITTFLSLGLVAAGLTGSTPAVAQEADAASKDTVIVSPPVTELSADPGQELEYKVTITNATTRDRTFSTSFQNAVPQGLDGAPSLVPDDGPYATKNWMSATPSSKRIAAGDDFEYQIKIKVPQDAGPGSHSGAIVFSPAVDPSDGAAVSVVAEVSSLILVNVSGEIRNGTSLDSFKADKSFYQSGPVNFTAIFKNDGNVVSRPVGEVKIKNIFGKTIATLPVEAQRVLPTAQRQFKTTFDQKNLFGMYTAEFTWSADSQTAAPTSVRIWAAPLKIVLPILAVLILLFLLVWLPRKRLKSAVAAFKAAGAESKKAQAPSHAKSEGAHLESTSTDESHTNDSPESNGDNK